jgi:V/A-type H+-transporting ATPase subunit F
MDYFFIGDPELVSAFRFIGIDGIAAPNPEAALAAFLGLTRGWDSTAGAVLPSVIPGAEACQVLILTEEAADWLGDDLIQWQLSGHYPLVVEIPGLMGRQPGRKTLVDAIREAVGIRV